MSHQTTLENITCENIKEVDPVPVEYRSTLQNSPIPSEPVEVNPSDLRLQTSENYSPKYTLLASIALNLLGFIIFPLELVFSILSLIVLVYGYLQYREHENENTKRWANRNLYLLIHLILQYPIEVFNIIIIIPLFPLLVFIYTGAFYIIIFLAICTLLICFPLFPCLILFYVLCLLVVIINVVSVFLSPTIFFGISLIIHFVWLMVELFQEHVRKENGEENYDHIFDEEEGDQEMNEEV